MSWFFPCSCERTDLDGFLLQARDVPEAIAEGQTLDEAKKELADVLLTCAEVFNEVHRVFPCPSKPAEGDVLVELPASVVAKILLSNAMISSNTRQIDLANRLGLARQEITRLMNFRRKTRIDLIEKAIAATGNQLSIGLA